MGKRKEKNAVHIDTLNLEIDYDKLADAIVRARRLEDEKKKLDRSEEIKTWQRVLGYNDFSEETGCKKRIFKFCNSIKVIWKLMFISKKEHIAVSPTSGLIQGMTSAFFSFIQIILTLGAVVLLFAPVLLTLYNGVEFVFSDWFMFIGLSVFSFMLSRIFRLMAIEIEQMSDREQVMGIFTAVISVTPILEKAIEVMKEVF